MWEALVLLLKSSLNEETQEDQPHLKTHLGAEPRIEKLLIGSGF